jgi:hypothetical protein
MGNRFIENILRLFNPEEAVTIEQIEQVCPVDSWWKSGSSMLARVGNIYYKDGKTYISIEIPIRNPKTNEFFMQKEDDLEPLYLNGWERIEGKEADKLEKSYWKTHEKELAKMSKDNKNEYNAFVKLGSKKR